MAKAEQIRVSMEDGVFTQCQDVPRIRTFGAESADLACLITLCFVALAVNFYGINWGLPNGNITWASDAIRPAAPLSIAHRILAGPPWNTGWFWFKYPLGHVLILCIVYSPYMLGLWLSGQISDPSSLYPYGFSQPEVALSTLALLGRSVSAIMGAGCTALVFLSCRKLFGRCSAVAAAVIVTFAYPVVYYSHTTNVEIPYIFWLLLAFYASVKLSLGAGARWYLVLGGAAAMAFSTKELAAGFLIALPLPLLLWHWRQPGRESFLPRGAVVGLMTALVVLVIANNAVLNPSGFSNRIRFLSHTLDPATLEKYAAYYFPVAVDGPRGLTAELSQLKVTAQYVARSLGWPASVAALLGIVVCLVNFRWQLLLLILPSICFYLLGPRATLSLRLRYVLPLAVVSAMFAGVGIAWLWTPSRRRLATRAVAIVVVSYTMVYGLDVDRMFAHDGRYGAERWLRQHAMHGSVIEVYQSPTYLPRFPTGVEVRKIPFDEIRSPALLARNPDYVVLSSAGIARVTVRYSKDWQQGKGSHEKDLVPAQRSVTGQVINYEHIGNRAFLRELRDGSLGYVLVARFSARPWIKRPAIQSLNPEIVIYGRRRSAMGSSRGNRRERS